MPPNDVKMGGMPIYSPLRAAQAGGGVANRRRPISWEPTATNDEAPKLREDSVGNNHGQQQHRRRFCWSEQRSSRMLEPIRQMDEELKRLREAPVQMSKSAGKFQLSIDMSIFRAEDIELILSPGRLIVCGEREVRLDDFTSIGRHFRRQLAIPDDVAIDALATQFNANGKLTITMLRRPRARA